MLVGLPSSLHTPQQNGIGTSGRTECQLIQGQSLTASGNDTLLGGLGERRAAMVTLGRAARRMSSVTVPT